MPKVSILMNAYNAQKYLKDAIDSIYAQTFQDWEIIFIDNCSTDDSKLIVDGYDDKIKYFKTPKNIPLGEARNFGLTHCNNEYLAFLDTDDIWLVNKLEVQVDLMDKNTKLQMCYSGVIYIDENSNEKKRFIPQAETGYVLREQLKRYEINMQSVIIRNNIEIDFNKTMQFSPDFDLFIKIASMYDIGVIKEYLVKYRKVENSLTSKKIDRWWIETKQTLDEVFQNKPELKEKYPKEYEIAYAKVHYYKACYLISIGNKGEATKELGNSKFVSKIYFILYIISLFPTIVWKTVHKLK